MQHYPIHFHKKQKQQTSSHLHRPRALEKEPWFVLDITPRDQFPRKVASARPLGNPHVYNGGNLTEVTTTENQVNQPTQTKPRVANPAQ
jgi:hypothetical protein